MQDKPDLRAHVEARTRNLGALLDQVRQRVRFAQHEMGTKAKDEARKLRFARIADLIMGEHWGSVRPSMERGQMGHRFADTADFDPAAWPEVSRPVEIAQNLEDCRREYRQLLTLYNKLSPAEQQALFPNGLPNP